MSKQTKPTLASIIKNISGDKIKYNQFGFVKIQLSDAAKIVINGNSLMRFLPTDKAHQTYTYYITSTQGKNDFYLQVQMLDEKKRGTKECNTGFIISKKGKAYSVYHPFDDSIAYSGLITTIRFILQKTNETWAKNALAALET